MKIKVEFTVDVPRASLEALRDLAEADTNSGAAEFVRMEARQTIDDYLRDNGVRDVTITEAWERKGL